MSVHSERRVTADPLAAQPNGLPGLPRAVAQENQWWNSTLAARFADVKFCNNVVASERRNRVITQWLWVQIPFPPQICRMTQGKFN